MPINPIGLNILPPVWEAADLNTFFSKIKPTKIDINTSNVESIFGLPPLEECPQQAIEKIKCVFSSNQNIKYSTLVGLEIEVENISNRPILTPIFSYLEDGSLRNNGIEYVSSPIPANAVPVALTYFNANLKACNIPIYSHRTSIHVHVNVRDFSVEQLKSFLFLYLCLENLLYQFAGENRNKSIFCVPLSHTHYVENFSILFKKDCSLPELTNVVRSWHKYTGCNLQPIKKYGTIEFRHLPGTDDEKKICNWINLILSVHEYAKNNSIEKLISIAENLNTNSEYELFLNEIFKEHMPLFSPYNIQQEMEKDILHIKKCLFLLQNKTAVPFNKETFEKSFFYKVQKVKPIPPIADKWSVEELSKLTYSSLQEICREVERRHGRASSQEERNDLFTKYTAATKAKNIVGKKEKGLI